MNAPWPFATPSAGADGAERWAVAALDHFTARCGYRAAPEPRPAAGGWRRRYVKDGAAGAIAAVGSAGARFASLGVEIEAPRALVRERAHALASALAPYEVALDPDAGPDPHAPDAVVRVALRLFLDGLTEGAVRDACGNLTAAAIEARRVLAATSPPAS